MKSIALWYLLLGAAALAQQTEYEYVIIGSGPGGGTLAANLARDGHSVFLIEAGDDQGHNLTEVIPGFNTIASETPGFAWNFFVNHFKNETQARRDNKYTYRLTNGSLYVGLDPPANAKPLGILYPRGSTLGGSSEVNGMNWALPPDNDWRYIANLTDDDSWRPEQMRQYFMELERNEYLPEGVPGHGYDGYVSSVENNLTYVTGRPGVVKVVEQASRMIEGINIESTQQLNDLLNRDMNRINTSRYEEQGVYRFPVHIDSLKRRSGARNRIADTLAARDEDGNAIYPLTLSTHSLASKVLFQHRADRKPRAYGVEYLQGEALYSVDARYNANQTAAVKRVYASKEVIVSGGSFNTPQFLKLSGIGPAEELQRLGIPVVVDLPAVGNNMRDNYEGGVVVQANVDFENNPFANCTYSLSNQTDPCLEQWENDHTGPYGEGGTPLTMWYRSKQSQNNDSDVFFFGGASAVFRGYFPGYSREQVPASTFYWSMVKMKPRNAAGTVELRSTNPREASLINFNYFEQGGTEDLAALAESATVALSIFNATGNPYTP